MVANSENQQSKSSMMLDVGEFNLLVIRKIVIETVLILCDALKYGNKKYMCINI